MAEAPSTDRGLRRPGARSIRAELRSHPWSAAALAGLVLAATLVRLPFMTARVTPTLQGDTMSYLKVAGRMAGGQLFATDELHGYGYPSLLALLRPLGDLEHAVTVLQHLIGIGTVAAVGLLAWLWFGRLPALLTAALVACSPLQFWIEDDALPDSLIGAGVLATGAFAVTIALRDGRPRRWPIAGAGAVIAMTVLLKPVGWVLLFAVPLTLLLAGRGSRAALRSGGAVAAVTLALLAPWIMHDLVRYGSPTLSAGGGAALFNRAFETGGLPLPRGNPTEISIADAFAQAPPGSRPTFVALALLRRSRSGRQALDDLGGIAARELWRDPAAYAWGTAELLTRYPREMQGPRGTWLTLLPRTSAGTWLSTTLWEVGRLLAAWWLVLTGAGLTALLAATGGPRRSRIAATGLLAAGLPVALLTAATHGGLPRYSLELAPLLWVVSVAGAVRLAHLALAGARAQRDSYSNGSAPAISESLGALRSRSETMRSLAAMGQSIATSSSSSEKPRSTSDE